MNTTVPSLVCVPVLCISTYLVYLPLEVNRPLLCPRSWAATCSLTKDVGVHTPVRKTKKGKRRK
eukprot:1163940-Pyramimonas_sp.AAC.1